VYIILHAARWPRVLMYTRPIVHLAFPKSTACMYAATYTRPTVRHVYNDRTRGELQVAKFMFFCSGRTFGLRHFNSFSELRSIDHIYIYICQPNILGDAYLRLLSFGIMTSPFHTYSTP